MVPTTIRTLREARGLTQARLAKRAGVGQPVVSDLERGVRKPWPALRARLATALHVSETALFAPEPDESGQELIAAVGALSAVVALDAAPASPAEDRGAAR